MSYEHPTARGCGDADQPSAAQFAPATLASRDDVFTCPVVPEGTSAYTTPERNSIAQNEAEPQAALQQTSPTVQHPSSNDPTRPPLPPPPYTPSTVPSPPQPPQAQRSTRSGHAASNDGLSKDPTVYDPANGALLIHPKKIDNLRRFRVLFVGILVSISSSTQGLHSVFGVLYLQQTLLFNVRQMTIIYLAGTAMGMFTFPFAALYDWFGPRVPIAVASAIGALGHLLFALTFGGHITASVTHCAVFYAIMCWGCYGLDVVVVPTVLTHMPRDRGQPTGVLLTFSSMGASFFACLFRGFFEGSYEHLMWLMFAVVVAAGVAGTWYLEDAPYVVNRWRRRRITPRPQLRAFLIRNRYMSQLVPQRRYGIMTLILVLLNFYLTIQTTCVAYLAADITAGKLRGIAIGSIVIVLFILILVVPVNAIDGLSEQDKEVIAAAKEKEAALRAMQAERRAAERSGGDDTADHEGVTPVRANRRSLGHAAASPSTHALPLGESDARESASGSAVHAEFTSSSDGCHLPDDTRAFRNTRHGADLANSDVFQRAEAPREEPRTAEFLCNDTELVAVDISDIEADDTDENPAHTAHVAESKRGRRSATSDLNANASLHTLVLPRVTVSDSSPACERHDVTLRKNASVSFYVAASHARHSNPLTLNGNEKVDEDGSQSHDALGAHPIVETINLCGEVYVVPVYQTTFLQSLTYLDMWLIFYTTLCVWGVGLTMTGNWNIQVMVKARYGAMEAKHYILFAAMAGVSVAGGRVFLGVYERLLKVVRERTGVAVVPTLIYPIASVGFFVGVLFWLTLPGDKVLILSYLIAPFFYGVNTSATFYVLGTIFDRDIGMHYAFCYLGAGIGFVLCYWCSWYLTYKREASPLTLGFCVGQRRCMNRAVGVYLCLAFCAILSSLAVHRRYSKLVHGRLAQRRVIVPRVRALVSVLGGSRRTGAGGGSEKMPANGAV